MRITKENTTALFIDFQERLFPAMNEKECLLKNAKILIGGLQLLGIPVAFTQHYTKGLGETLAEISVLVPDFKAIEKTDFSCFSANEYRTFLDLNQTKNFTLSVYANPTGGTTLDAVGDLVAAKLITNAAGVCLTSYGIYYSATTNKFSAIVCSVDGSGQLIASTHSFPFGAWYKVQMKFSTSANGKVTKIKLMVNGKSEGAIKLNSFAGILFGSAGFQVGAANFEFNDHGVYRRNFIGNIDEVKLTGQLP